ncbi:MAG TPA: hypothetical protein VF116_04680 [Ktedonobacterales bacterium]
MLSRKSDPRADARKMSSLAIAWGIVAGIAYLGLIGIAIKFLKSQVSAWQGITVDPGVLQLAQAKHSTNTTISTLVIAALPVAIIAVIALGIVARARPSVPVVGPLLILAALLGLAGSVLLFLGLVVNAQNGTELAVALATIVIVAILLRLSRYIRRFYSRSPAAATMLFALLTVAYLILSNGGGNISTIVLSQVDVWLSLIAFAIALYSGAVVARARRRMRKG